MTTKTITSWVRKVGSRLRKKHLFTTSADYWEDRYRAGGNSGAGSYNRLARFKADFINSFVEEQGINSVVEFGSGDGAQLALASYPTYIGVDVSPTILEIAKRKFGSDPCFSFLHFSEVTPDVKADLGLSLDVIYHLVEDDAYLSYMNQLFDAAERAVIIYASNEDKPWADPHVRHRKFTHWVAENRPDFTLIQRVPNQFPYDPSDPHNTSFADFYVYEKALS